MPLVPLSNEVERESLGINRVVAAYVDHDMCLARHVRPDGSWAVATRSVPVHAGEPRPVKVTWRVIHYSDVRALRSPISCRQRIHRAICREHGQREKPHRNTDESLTSHFELPSYDWAIHMPEALPAVSCALVGDVAYVVRIETLRSTPLIVDRSTKAKVGFDRTFTRRPRLTDSSARDPRRNRIHAALRLPPSGLMPRKIRGKEV